MSALYVRQTFRQWAQNVSAISGVAFYDTINRDPKPDDATWWTCAFNALTMEGQTYCGPGYLESGVIEAYVLSRPGQGDEIAVAALEEVVQLLFSTQQDATQRFSLGQFDPVLEISAGSADYEYVVGTLLSYRLSL